MLRHAKRGTPEINCCRSASTHDIYQKFYYCSLNLLLIPKPSSNGKYVDVCFSEPERLLQTTYSILAAILSNKTRSYYSSLKESSEECAAQNSPTDINIGELITNNGFIVNSQSLALISLLVACFEYSYMGWDAISLEGPLSSGSRS